MIVAVLLEMDADRQADLMIQDQVFSAPAECWGWPAEKGDKKQILPCVNFRGVREITRFMEEVRDFRPAFSRTMWRRPAPEWAIVDTRKLADFAIYIYGTQVMAGCANGRN